MTLLIMTNEKDNDKDNRYLGIWHERNECDDVISSTETLFLGENVILRKMHEILHPVPGTS